MFCQNKVGALGLQGADGSFAEYVIADSQFTVPIPSNVSFADTVTPSPLLTLSAPRPTNPCGVGPPNVCRRNNLLLHQTL
jgi:NADPH:quinone reductase-like Zn-dependent oxidoreductase